MARRAILAATLLLAPLLLAAPAQACAVPCGRIYPLITIQPDLPQEMWDMSSGETLTIPATLRYKFDMTQEGYTVPAPNEPIEIRFEFPRLPDWAEIKVEPEVVPIDVANPLFVKPNNEEPTNPQAQYEFTAPITITANVVGQPVLKDGYDYGKLLVFAKSSESGLYQAGYGIKEMRVVPEGAVHESDVAGQRDVFESVPLPPIALGDLTQEFAGTTVTLTPPASPQWWQPSEFVATVDPAPAGRMVFALHDEGGGLVAQTASLDSAVGEARMNVTLAKPGRHVATLTLLPDAGTMTPPITYAFPLDVGVTAAEGHVWPKTYLLAAAEAVPAPLASEDDPLTQFERDIPFFAFDTAQSVAASVTLKTTGVTDAGRGIANLQFSIHDPDGNMLSAGSVDPTKPTWSLRVGSLPSDGWYVLRIRGIGAPGASGYDARVEVNYAAAHVARNRADGVLDATGPVLGVGGVNVTLPEGAKVWAPSDVTPAVAEGAASPRYQVTIYDETGALAYASGARTGPASFSAPAPGMYTAYVFAEPETGSLPFSPVVRAFTFPVGVDDVTIASTFTIEDLFEIPSTPSPTLLGFARLPDVPGAGEPVVEGAEVIDGYLHVVGDNVGVQPGSRSVQASLDYASPVSLPGSGALAATTEEGGLAVPGIAVAAVIIALGALAVAMALFRRR